MSEQAELSLSGIPAYTRKQVLSLTILGEFAVLLVAGVGIYLARIDLSPILGTLPTGGTELFTSLARIAIPGVIAAAVVTIANLLIMHFSEKNSDNNFFLRSMRDLLEMIMMPLMGPFTVLDSIVVAAISGISEELLFRGVIQNQAIALFNYCGLHSHQLEGSICISASLFGLAHFRNWHFSPYAMWAMLVGVLMSYLLILTGSLYTPMLAHALVNLVSINVLRGMYKRRNESTQPKE